MIAPMLKTANIVAGVLWIAFGVWVFASTGNFFFGLGAVAVGVVFEVLAVALIRRDRAARERRLREQP